MGYPQHVVLDANGVLYQVGDDIHELFIPFLRAHGCTLSEAEVVAAYRECSLGRFDSAELWRRCGMQQNLDAKYLPLYQPHAGVFPFLRRAKAAGLGVAVLTNDVAAWLGMKAVCMPSDDKSGPGGHRVVATFDDLAALVFPPA